MAIAQNLTMNASAELARIAQHLRQSTVQVRCRRSGGGSGAIWPDRRESVGTTIITNAHVATQEHLTVELWDGRVFEALRTAIDPKRDLAALKVEATGLPTARIGDADGLRVGELVLAVGHPFGVAGAVTAGMIHAVAATQNRQNWVMADIRLAPGNSGGPLANAHGDVIGINTMIADGLGLAVSSNQVEGFLRDNSRPYLGVTMRPVLVEWENQQVLGLLVLDVAFGSLAMAAGLVKGDAIVSVFGQFFQSPDDLASVLWHARPGTLLPLEFVRSRQRYHCTVMVGAVKGFAGVTGVKVP